MVTAPDFKTIARTALGDSPTLEKVNEHGEYKYGSVSEAREAYSIASYGKIVALTRQTLINDDLSAFTRLPEMFGRAAADLESDTVWGIITANAALADSIALFHASHGNLPTGAAISVAQLGVCRAAMRVQTGLDGRKINVTPRYLLVPAALETIAQQFTSQAYAASASSSINPFAGALQVLAEPRLDTASTTAWYMAADPAQIDTIEYAYLEGNQGVPTSKPRTAGKSTALNSRPASTSAPRLSTSVAWSRVTKTDLWAPISARITRKERNNEDVQARR